MLETTYSKEGPDDDRCFFLDKRMYKKYPMEKINDIGYNCVHSCIRDLIIIGKTKQEISDETGLTKDTVVNSAKRMLMTVKSDPKKVENKKRKPYKKYKKRNSSPVFEEHKCTNPLCNKKTTNRFLCDECYYGNSDEINYAYL